MKEKVMFAYRWVKCKYFYVRFKMERNKRKKALFRMEAKQAYKALHRA